MNVNPGKEHTMTYNLGNIEDLRVESGENGWELHFTTTDHGSFIGNIHGISEQLVEAAKPIADYWAEGRAAAAEHQRDLDARDPDGYAPDDPKSFGFHDRAVAAWDNREKS